MSEDRRAQMTRDVLAAIRLGEDTGCDFKAVHIQGKQVFERNDDVADDIAALANGRGGRLILGVEDKTRHVQGIALGDLDRVEQVLREIAKDKIDPMVHIETWRLEVPDTAGIMKPVLVVDVPKSLFVHRSPSGYRKRFGASQRALKPDELMRLMQQRNQSRSVGFDELPFPQTTPAEMNAQLAARFVRDPSDPAAHRKLRLIAADEDGFERMSVAAVLLCTNDPQAHLPGAYIQCVHYPAISRAEGGQLDAFDAVGPLDR